VLLPSLPPGIDLTPQCHAVFRFLSFTTGTVSCLTKDLINICGGIVIVANTTARPVATSVKIHYVRMWPAAAGFAALTWGTEGERGKDVIKDETTPTGVVYTGCVQHTPPKTSPWREWFFSGSDLVFQLTAAAGTVVDVSVSWAQSGAYQSSNAAITAGGLGTFGYFPLDGITSNGYKPTILTAFH